MSYDTAAKYNSVQERWEAEKRQDQVFAEYERNSIKLKPLHPSDRDLGSNQWMTQISTAYGDDEQTRLKFQREKVNDKAFVTSPENLFEFITNSGHDSYVIVDLRSPDDFAESHIIGSLNYSILPNQDSINSGVSQFPSNQAESPFKEAHKTRYIIFVDQGVSPGQPIPANFIAARYYHYMWHKSNDEPMSYDRYDLHKYQQAVVLQGGYSAVKDWHSRNAQLQGVDGLFASSPKLPPPPTKPSKWASWSRK